MVAVDLQVVAVVAAQAETKSLSPMLIAVSRKGSGYFI